MKRVLNIAKRDLKSGLRDFLIIYIIIAPIIIAFILSGFIPSAESASLTFAVDSSISNELVEEFKKYGTVEIFQSKKDLEERVSAIDDVIGITAIDGIYEIVAEGNETEGMTNIPKNIISKYTSVKEGNVRNIVNVNFSDVGYEISPIAIIGGISVIILSVVLAGMVVGLNIVDEKDAKTIKALNTTPMSRTDFIIGKSLTGCLISLVQIFIIMMILGFTEFNFIMALVFSLVNFLIVILFGFLIGFSSPNQMAAAANMKILLLPVSIAIAGAVLLPMSKHFLLYWCPFYWMYRGYGDIMKNTATWSNIGIYSIWILGITAVLIIALRKKVASNFN